MRFVGATSRLLWLHRERREQLEKQKKGLIYAFWHGRQGFLPYLHRGPRNHPLISNSKDGELITQICNHFNLRAIRGSSSRGGSKALLQLRKEIEAGELIGITPDGPRGPFHSINPGILFLAQQMSCPIIPIAYSARRKWIVGSWDQFLIPKPFNRIAIAYGEPFWIKPTDDLSLIAPHLKERLDAITAEADHAVEFPKRLKRTMYVKLFYNVMILLLLPFIILFVFIRWRKRVWSKGFLQLSHRFGFLSKDEREKIFQDTRPKWWIHAASIGEVKAIQTFLERLPKATDVHTVLTTVTPEAYQWAKKEKVADTVLTAPFDLLPCVWNFFRQIRPAYFISVESELWPNLMWEAKASGAKVAFINGRLSERSFRSYRRFQWILKSLWTNVDCFSVRQQQDADRFQGLGVDPSKIVVTGNLKYDRLPHEEMKQPKNPSEPLTIVIGSTREGEEAILLPIVQIIRRAHPNVRWIWAPRHIERLAEIESLFRAQQEIIARKSVFLKESWSLSVLWDSVGDLMQAYAQSDLAIIGGSFVKKGGQNPIEPAALGLPVIFGPSMENFYGVSEKLVEKGGAFQVSVDQLGDKVSQLITNESLRKSMGNHARAVVDSEQGATDQTIRQLIYLSK